MKKLVFILMFLASAAYARGGPKYSHDAISPKLQDEIDHIYEDNEQDLYNGGRISSGTIANLTVSTLTYTTLNPSISSPTITSWTAYTPTITGVGTATNVQFYYKQITDTIYVHGGFRCGTVTASSVTITLPNSTLISYSRINATIEPVVGTAYRQSNAAGPTTQSATDTIQIFGDGVVTDLVSLGIQHGGGAIVKGAGSSLFSNTDWISVKFSYPINP